MDIGINCWAWGAPITTEKLAEIAPKVSEMGFDVLEIPIEELGDLDYERGREILDEHGLDATVVAVMPEKRDLLVSDDDVRARTRSYIRGCIDATETLGATRLGGPMYAAVGRTWLSTPKERTEEINLLAKQLRSLGEYADDRGVVLCIEVINRYETSFLTTTEQGVELIEAVDHPSVQLLLDTFHMNIEERDFAGAIETGGSHIQHVHACGNDRGAPGSGHIPWPEIKDALEDVGYEGPLVIETLTPELESIAKAAAIWRPLASSQDALAEEGLKNLREIFE